MKDRLQMKSALLIARLALTVSIFALVAARAASAPSASPTVAPDSASGPHDNQIHLSSGVADILKLGRAGISEDVILAFLQSSGDSYDLSAPEVVYLKKEGVPDKVLAAMLAQHKTPAQPVTAAAAPAAQPAYAGAPNVQYVPVYQPAPTVYVQPPTTYVTQYPSTTYTYYDFSPYYYRGYCTYPSPFWSFSVGLGCGRGGFRSACYYGGGFRGGGFRGGVSYHGGGGFRGGVGLHGGGGMHAGGFGGGIHGGRR